jgi:phosphatidylglycerol:prolipoprotein diacylglycerol transferase
VIAVWIQPGLSLYGAITGGLLAMLYISRKYKIRVAYVLDALAFSLPWALIIGSIGSYLDGTVVGKLTQGWGVAYLGFPGRRHPVQLYEGIFLFFLYLLLLVLQRRAIKRGWSYGVAGLWFFTLFAIGMFSIEFFKEGSVYFSRLSANQWVLVGFFAEALGAFYVRGGGKEFILHQTKYSRLWLEKLLGNLYAKFPKKHSS